ncbi:CPBP family intramembrane glutamic endopeptidase [Bacillus sp. AK128]
MKNKVMVLIGKTVLSLIIVFASIMLFTILFQLFSKGFDFYLFATPIGLMLSAYIMYAWFEKRNGWIIGWRDGRAAGNTLTGSIIASIIIAVSVSLVLITGTVTLESNSLQSSVLIIQVVLFLSISIGEEWFFRGYLFGVYKEVVGMRFAIIVNSIVFTAVHLLNPEAFGRPLEFIGIEMVNIFLMSILLSQARALTGSLWMPIGMHLLLNFLQSTVFGFVNGGKEVASLYNLTYDVKTIWNGSTHGLESSLLFTPILIIAVMIFSGISYYHVKSNKKIMQM